MKFMFDLQHPLTCKPWTTLSNPCNKVRGKYVVKKSSCVFLPASLSLCRCELFYIYMWMYVDVNLHMWLYNRRSRFNPRSIHTNDSKKWYLIPPCLTLSIIRYKLRVSREIQWKEWQPLLHLSVVAIEKVTLDYGQPTYIYIYIYYWIKIQMIILWWNPQFIWKVLFNHKKHHQRELLSCLNNDVMNLYEQ